MPATTHAYQGNSDVGLRWPPQRDDCHHRRSRSRSPVSPGCARETLAEREERWLAEAALPVGPPAGQPRAGPADPEPPAQEPVPAGEAAPAAQAAAPAALAPREALGAQGAETAAPASRATAPASHTTAPSTPPARGTGPCAGPERLAGGRLSRSGEKGGLQVPRSHQAQPHQPPKPYPPKAAFCKGRPRPVRSPAPTRSAPSITLLHLQRPRDAQRVVQEGADGARAWQGTGHRSAD